MRKLSYLVCLYVCIGFGLAGARADVFTFQPSDSDASAPDDLWDLVHQDYVTWGISWTVPSGQHIIGASLFIDNINDWQVERGDILYVHLLDDPPVGVQQGYDNQGGGDAFAGQGILLTTYSDYGAGPEDWTYTFTPAQIGTLSSYFANGVSGFGLDPDCHYYNDGVTFTVVTDPVPAPGAALLGAMGLGLIGWLRRSLA